MNHLVSVIIPTYNEEKEISFCLKSLKGQSYKKMEIIIIDDGSTDNTLREISRFKGIKVIKGLHKGPGISRNLGAKKAKGDILVFVDADMTFQKDYIKNLIKPIIKNSKAIGTTHEYEEVSNLNNIWSRCWGKIRVAKENAHEVKIFRAIRKSEFFRLGCFDPKWGYADDQTFWIKYGIKPVPAKNTICYHKNPETLKGVYKQSKWISSSIDNIFTLTPILKYLSPLFMTLISPLTIPILSIKKCRRNKSFAIFLPMLVFMTSRYFGTVSGIARRIYLHKIYH